MLVAAALAGCAVGPDYRGPAPPATARFTRDATTEPAADAPAPAADWWQVYRSPRLTALVERALARNSDIEVATANLRAAQANVRAQRGLFFPSLTAGYTASRQNTGEVLSSPLNPPPDGSPGPNPFTLHTAQLTVGYVPDVFGGNLRQVESLSATERASALQLTALRLTVASNTAAAAIQESLLLEQLTVLENTVAVAEAQLAHLQGMAALGYASALDVAQQQVALAQAQTQLPPLRKQLEQTRDLLAILCGDLPASDAGLPPAGPIGQPASLPAVVPSQLVAVRPDVQAAKAQWQAAHAQIGVATANMLPQFSISANLAWNGEQAGGLLAMANRSWGLAAGLTQPLFAGGALRARRDAAVAGADAARAQYQSTLLSAFQNVADTLYALQHDGDAMAANERAREASARLVALTQRQLDAGYASRPALLVAQQGLLQARLAALTARAAWLGDTVALQQALGGGWHSETDR